MEKRYRALRIISTLYKILGIIVLVIAIIGAVGACLAGILGGTALQSLSNDLGQSATGVGILGSALSGIIAGVISLIGGGLSGLSLYAAGEGISLLIAMEENTRSAAMHMAAMNRPAAPAALPPQG